MLERWSWSRVEQQVCVSPPVAVPAGNPIPSNLFLTSCALTDVEKPAHAAVSLPDFVALPITSWLPCDLMVKLFGDYVITMFHQDDRTSQISILLVQLQGKIGVDFRQVLLLLPETSSCCQLHESKNCIPGDCSGF